ncbi:copper transport protein ycnJ [Methylomarinovum tepidoasis]|uniref:Copper resistance protein C n=1 Tax=Methylomarinovum tepidoasis TaxID=2840183 RepID=A0AAU9C924_9GAMM|nr:copper resistance CopC family protein [Methylomarinovum sp. IN45]BCX88346.1 copper transport protein ycnJ [Methylomarinovum sp. IN45]
MATKRLLLFWLATLLPLWAQAHAILVEANPAPKSVIKVSEAPREIWLRFDAGVGERYLALAVIDRSRKKRVDAKDADRDFTDPSIVRASFKEPLQPGKYMVRYRVQSADTHIITGRFQFTVVEDDQ